MKKAFIYTRVSTIEQVRGGYSIDEQKERLESYAKSKGYEVIKVYTDGGISGASINRPALQEMLENITATDVILVYKLDRLSRSQKDTLYLIEDVFLKNKVDFVSLNESFDTTTPFGRAMIGILSVFAQLEREQIKERHAMGKVGRAKKGKWFGGGKWKPFGYDYKDDELIVNEYEAQAVKKIYALADNGYGTGKIFKTVNEDFPDLIAGSSTIVRILKNPIYIGKVTWDGKTYDGLHESIIEEELYESVQRIKARNAEKYSKPKGTNYILTGHLVCSNCGSSLNGRRGGKRKDGTYLEYYVCNGQGDKPWKKNNPRCEMKSWRKEKLEQIVLSELSKLTVKAVKSKNNTEDNSKEIEVLNKEIEKVDSQIEKIIDLYVLEDIDMNKLQKRIDTLNDKKTNLSQRIIKLSDEDSAIKDKLEAVKTVDSFSDVDLETLSKEQQRLIVGKLIDSIKIYESKIEISWSF